MTHFIFHTANAISFNTPSTPFAFPTASRTSKGVDGGTWEGIEGGRKLINGVNKEMF